MAKFVIGGRQIKDLSKTLERRYRSCIDQSAATALSITAAQNRRAVQAQMQKKLHEPRKQTINAVLFRAAKADDGLNKMYSATFIRDWASEFLAPNFYGDTLTESYGREPVITPVVANLRNKTYGLGVKLNRFGNIPGINKGKLSKVLDSPNTFQVPLNRGLRAVSGETLTPGIWYRNPRTNEITLLFLYERDTERRKLLDFNRIGQGVYDNNIAKNWRRAMKDCLGE